MGPIASHSSLRFVLALKPLPADRKLLQFLSSENNFQCNHYVMYRRINLLPEFLL